MPKNIFYIIVFSLLISCTTLNDKLYFIAPTQLPDTTRKMKSPGFWIGLNKNPDKIIMTQDEINAFNEKIRGELKSTCNILDFNENYDGIHLKKSMINTLKYFRKGIYYDSKNSIVTKSYFDNLEKLMNLKEISDKITPYYGVLTEYSNQKVFPADKSFYLEPKDVDFDELQNSGFDACTPLLILHESGDGGWVYAVTDITEGWFKKESIAFCSYEELKNYLQSDFCVVISSKADIYLKDNLTDYIDNVRMGNKLLFSSFKNNVTAEILFPVKNGGGKLELVKAYVKSSDISKKYLSYTPRIIIEQAFKLLNAPYGWGDMYGEQDCSRFIWEIFSTAGIKLPRNSRAQGRAGLALGEFNKKSSIEEKLSILQDTPGGITILRLNGHIMLYLGMFENKPFAIHETWAYKQNVNGIIFTRVINKVAVTNLELGSGTKKGSLLERIININTIY
jgi:hypothetical protein